MIRNGDPAEKARKTVRSALDRAYEKLKQADMLSLAQHLSDSIECHGDLYSYRPADQSIQWVV